MVDVRIFETREELGKQAALHGAESIRTAIAENGYAFIVLATGSSQFEMLAHLVQLPDIDWSAVTAFHLDEYIGLSSDHKASFRRYLRERFVQPIGGRVTLHEIDGEADPHREVERLNELLQDKDIAVIFAGIGENCHLAFNDPPADFNTASPYLLVDLDEACRLQQVGEGWFADLDGVPKRAISMSINQIMKGKHLILSASGERKAEALYHAMKGGIDPNYPASIVQRHNHATWFLDRAAAARLT